MRFLNPGVKFSAALVVAAAFCAPALAAPPMDHMGSMGTHHMDSMHDHGHRPPMRTEHRPRMPHRGMHWRGGNWAWRNNAWAWVPGIWIR
jgi:hypothetical protein